MSGFERRTEIYVQPKVAKQLRLALTIYPQKVATRMKDQFGYTTTTERIMTVEDLAEMILSNYVKEHFPLVLELEEQMAHLQKQIIEKAKQAEK